LPALNDEILIDELAQDTGEALLCDFQNIQQLGDRQTRIAIDEMQHAMMRAAKSVVIEDGIGFGHEIAVSEKQQLDQFDGSGVAVPCRSSLFGRLVLSVVWVVLIDDAEIQGCLVPRGSQAGGGMQMPDGQLWAPDGIFGKKIRQCY
jgi:hypothetical protein